jgi:hypothetical protein
MEIKKKTTIFIGYDVLKMQNSIFLFLKVESLDICIDWCELVLNKKSSNLNYRIRVGDGEATLAKSFDFQLYP